MRYIVFSLFMAFCVHGEAQLFQQAFVLQGSDYIYQILEDSSGNIWMAGSTRDTVVGHTDFFVVKSNGAGDTIFTRTFGTAVYDDLTAACVTNDGGVLLTGTNYDTAQCIVVIKVNANGTAQWSRLFQVEMFEEVSSVIQTSDGGYLIYGSTYVNAGIFLLKLDPNGAVTWLTQFTDGLSTYITSASVEEYQNEFVFTGTKMDSMADVFIGAVDFSGTLTWCYDLGLTNCFVNGIKSTGAGNFILCGYAENLTETFLAKVNYGNVIWSYTYTLPGVVYPEEMTLDNDGNILMTGTVMDAISNLYLLKVDSSGIRKWSMLYADNSIGLTVSCSANGEYLLGGSIYDPGMQNGQAIAYAIRTDTSGSTSCGNYYTDGLTTVLQSGVVQSTFFSSNSLTNANYSVTIGSGAQFWDMCPVGNDESKPANENCSIYPNPFVESFVVECTALNLQTTGLFFLYDPQGKLVRTQRITQNITVIERENLMPGIYFYHIVQDGTTIGRGTLAAE